MFVARRPRVDGICLLASEFKSLRPTPFILWTICSSLSRFSQSWPMLTAETCTQVRIEQNDASLRHASIPERPLQPQATAMKKCSDQQKNRGLSSTLTRQPRDGYEGYMTRLSPATPRSSSSPQPSWTPRSAQTRRDEPNPHVNRSRLPLPSFKPHHLALCFRPYHWSHSLKCGASVRQ